MPATLNEIETAECYTCPLCGKTILNRKDHLRDYHNFKDDVALQNFLSSNHFAFEKVLVQVKNDNECQTNLKEEILTESAKKKATSKNIPHHRCTRFSCKHCLFVHHIESVLEKHVRRKHLQVVVQSNQKYHWKEETMRVLLDKTQQVITKETIKSNLPTIIHSKDIKMEIEEEPSKDVTTHNGAYLIGDLVLARCMGHPWWPGMILKCPGKAVLNRTYDVMFFDDKKTTTGSVTEDKVKAYLNSRDNLLKSKTSKSQMRRLKQAYLWADMTIAWSNQERLDYFVHKQMPKREEEHPVPEKVEEQPVNQETRKPIMMSKGESLLKSNMNFIPKHSDPLHKVKANIEKLKKESGRKSESSEAVSIPRSGTRKKLNEGSHLDTDFVQNSLVTVIKVENKVLLVIPKPKRQSDTKIKSSMLVSESITKIQPDICDGQKIEENSSKLRSRRTYVQGADHIDTEEANSKLRSRKNSISNAEQLSERSRKRYFSLSEESCNKSRKVDVSTKRPKSKDMQEDQVSPKKKRTDSEQKDWLDSKLDSLLKSIDDDEPKVVLHSKEVEDVHSTEELNFQETSATTSQKCLNQNKKESRTKPKADETEFSTSQTLKTLTKTADIEEPPPILINPSENKICNPGESPIIESPKLNKSEGASNLNILSNNANSNSNDVKADYSSVNQPNQLNPTAVDEENDDSEGSENFEDFFNDIVDHVMA